MVTAASVQSLIIAEVGDTPDGLLAQQMATIWASYADKAYIWPRLQELYAKRRAIDFVMGTLRSNVDFSMSGDLSLKLSDRTAFLMDRRKEVQCQIEVEECKAQAVRVPVVTPLVTTEIEPAQPPGSYPVPDIDSSNSPVYRGDPYYDVGHPKTW